MIAIAEKTCKYCGQVRPITEFESSGKKRLRCLACYREFHRQLYHKFKHRRAKQVRAVTPYDFQRVENFQFIFDIAKNAGEKALTAFAYAIISTSDERMEAILKAYPNFWELWKQKPQKTYNTLQFDNSFVKSPETSNVVTELVDSDNAKFATPLDFENIRDNSIHSRARYHSTKPICEWNCTR